MKRPDSVGDAGSERPSGLSRYRHRIRVRYGEVDQQGVVFNAHYVAFIDDTAEHWVDALGIRRDPELAYWDFMLKTLSIEWHGSVGNLDWLEIDASVKRWGRSSFELRYVGSHDGREVFDASVVYVSVRLGENTSMPTPPGVRRAFGPEVEPAEQVGSAE